MGLDYLSVGATLRGLVLGEGLKLAGADLIAGIVVAVPLTMNNDLCRLSPLSIR